MPYWFELQRRVNQPAPLAKHWSIEEKEPILDYLHGDIGDDEVKAVCYYEFARQSETLRKARREYNPADPDNSSLTVSNHFAAWVLDPTRFCFLQCREFPDSAWRDLSKEDREHIRLLFKPISPRSIITDTLVLRGTGVFDAFMEQAKNTLNEFNQELAPPKTAKERKKTIKRVIQPAMVAATKNHPFIKHVVITVDYRDGAPAVTEQFVRWLDSGMNNELFKKYYKPPIHRQNPDSPARYKGLLKFLAACRLHDELDLKAAKEWTRENRRRKDHHPQPFFREKLRKTATGMHFRGPVFKEHRQWKDAVAKAESFLAREIEFDPATKVG